MKKRRELTLLPIRQALFVITLALPILSAQAESRAPQSTEGEIALEMFGLIAEQSGCSAFAAAWFDLGTQQVRFRCAETLADAELLTATSSKKTKFMIDISTAKEEYIQRFGNAGLHRPISLLAYLLANFRGKANQRTMSAPVLVYRPITQSILPDEKN